MISINQIYSSIALRKLAYFGSSTLGNDIYYLKEFVDTMINVIGEDEIVQLLKNDNSNNKTRNNYLGNNWSSFKKNFLRFDKVIEKTKASYDLLENDRKKDLKYSSFNDKIKSIPKMKQDLFTLFVFIIQNTSLQKMTIKTEDFKVMERKGYKIITSENKRKVGEMFNANKTEQQ